MLIGRLTADPVLHQTVSGQPVTNFSLATNRFYMDGETKKEVPDYHDCVAWNLGKRKLAEVVAQNLKKGALVYVEGRLQTRVFEANDGTTKRKTEINLTDVQFLESRAQRDAMVAATSGPKEPSRW
jgi:single-strand DNA-binding protein